MSININRVDQASFIDFVSRLKAIDSFLYFKLQNGNIKSVVYLPQRDAVKYHSQPIDQIFNISEGLPNKEIKVAFFDCNKVLDAIKLFGSDQIQAELNLSENEEDFVATSLRLFNDELEITLACSEPSLGFKDLTESQVEGIFSRESSDFNFTLDTFTLGKIKSMFALDTEETFEFIATGENVKTKGKTYNYTATSGFNGQGGHAIVYKKYLGLLDKEEQEVFVSGNKVVFKSNDSNTLLTIATCQTAE